MARDREERRRGARLWTSASGGDACARVRGVRGAQGTQACPCICRSRHARCVCWVSGLGARRVAKVLGGRVDCVSALRTPRALAHWAQGLVLLREPLCDAVQVELVAALAERCACVSVPGGRRRACDTHLVGRHRPARDTRRTRRQSSFGRCRRRRRDRAHPSLSPCVSCHAAAAGRTYASSPLGASCAHAPSCRGHRSAAHPDQQPVSNAPRAGALSVRSRDCGVHLHRPHSCDRSPAKTTSIRAARLRRRSAWHVFRGTTQLGGTQTRPAWTC